jgi:hypothetical protein
MLTESMADRESTSQDAVLTTIRWPDPFGSLVGRGGGIGTGVQSWRDHYGIVIGTELKYPPSDVERSAGMSAQSAAQPARKDPAQVDPIHHTIGLENEEDLVTASQVMSFDALEHLPEGFGDQAFE